MYSVHTGVAVAVHIGFEVAGGFGPVFVEVKQSILSRKKAKRSHSLFGGVAIVNPGKEIEVRPHPVSEEIGKEELDKG